ncbi:ATP-binding protein [Roseibacterium beibuensis]|uniref:ATP-binding protein n=1 Tax=[Roseibacterium] beibuensis TaxID=1193142 RepID=UPI00217CF85C|nr:ATP-binding protein [Roseibacterium beibuensis]MCS6626934.1 ATP-binding protein [Roseibacterium beibuensis]
MPWVARLRTSRFPIVALASLLVLLIAGVAIAVLNEQSLKVQTARQAGAQADLLASAVSGALAFDDRQAAQDYVNAVQVNPNVLAAAVYDENNRLVASFARQGEVIPPVATPRPRTTTFRDGRLYVVRPVQEAGQTLGTVRLRVLESPPAQRFSRYAGLLLVLGLAALVVVVLAVAQGALRRANRQLADRAAELVRANNLLQQQMIEREKAEEALRQSQKMEAIGRLTGGIAHDFNNLLMVASSGIELLDRTEDPTRRGALSAGVKQAVERGAALTRQLLAFARRSPLRAEVLDLRTHIEGLRFLLERSLREDVEVVLDLPDDLWRVEADRGELELALLNLAVNARDAMPHGGTLTLSGCNLPGEGEDPDRVCLKVADTGAGMSDVVASRVFEPFFTTKEVGRGTGLGLSQVYGFVRSSGGDISVESREGEGTTFTICLPRTDKAPRPVEPETPLPAGAPPARRKGGGRLLLVEDDDAVAAGVGHMLGDLGYRHVRVASAAEALEMLEKDPRFDLVFSDMVMPGEMDGLGLAQEVRRRMPETPVLLTTGFSEAASAATGEAFRLLPKPYGIDGLSEALAATLSDPKP